MARKLITATLASAALIAGSVAPAFASAADQPGRQNREQARENSRGPDNASNRGVERSNENSVLKGNGGDQEMQRRRNSQGGANASERARERANQNSAVRDIQPGMKVKDRNGRDVGTVKEVRRSPTGVVIAVIVVVVITGQVVTLSPATLTVIAGVIVTTQITAPTRN